MITRFPGHNRDLPQNEPQPQSTDLNRQFAAYYSPDDSDLDRTIRLEVFGRDVGQRSWAYADEILEYGQKMGLESGVSFLDVGCGFGGPTLFLMRQFGACATGIDVNPRAVRYARDLAQQAELGDRCRFLECDPVELPPLAESSYRGAVLTDMVCHLPDRASTYRQICSALEPGGAIVITDCCVVTGQLENNEVVARNMRVPYFYVPAGLNEKWLIESGFDLTEVRNTTGNLTALAAAELNVREKLKNELIQQDGEQQFDLVKRQLMCIYETSSTNRLSRFLYVATKPPAR